MSTLAAHAASQALAPEGIQRMRSHAKTLIELRERLIRDLASIPCIGKVLGTNDANFVLVQVLDAPKGLPDSQRAALVYKRMAEEHRLVVRNRSSELGCDGCLRITVGTAEENDQCIKLMKELLTP